MNIPVDAQSRRDRRRRRHHLRPERARQQIAGQIALAKFPNPAGLSRVWRTTSRRLAELRHLRPDRPDRRHPTAGTVLWGDAGTHGRGSMASGTLEMSNVDLAQEFTSMITAQRGFQANAPRHHDLGRDARRARQPEALVGQRALPSRTPRRWRSAPPARRGRRTSCASPGSAASAEENDTMIKVHHGREEVPWRQRRPHRDRRGDARHRAHADHGQEADRARRRRRRSSRSSLEYRRPAQSRPRVIEPLTIDTQWRPTAREGDQAETLWIQLPSSALLARHHRPARRRLPWKAATRRAFIGPVAFLLVFGGTPASCIASIGAEGVRCGCPKLFSWP